MLKILITRKVNDERVLNITALVNVYCSKPVNVDAC